MLYVADTHILIKYLAGTLPTKIEHVFSECENGEHIIFIPTIALAESHYLISKKKIDMKFNDIITKIENSQNFSIVPFNLDILKLFPTIRKFEMHDLIIVATTKYLNAKLITQDKELIRSDEVEIL